VALSYADIAMIAEALALTENPDADLYWRRALTHGDGGVETMISYCDYLYASARTDEARATMAQYRDSLPPGASSADLLGRSHYAQATFELRSGDPALARPAFEAAIVAFERIPSPSMRAYRVRSVKEAMGLPAVAH
jgi:hypothetical protein